jgi:hypothetical protein
VRRDGAHKVRLMNQLFRLPVQFVCFLTQGHDSFLSF